MVDESLDAQLLRTIAKVLEIERTDDELAALLPGIRARREMAAKVAALDLHDTPLAVTYNADWSDFSSAGDAPAAEDAP